MHLSGLITLLLVFPLALAGGCSSGHATIDSSVVLQPGDTAVLSTTGDEVTVSLVRTVSAGSAAAADGEERRVVVVLAGPASATGADGAWTARSTTPLRVGASVVHSADRGGSGEHRVMLVNGGETVAMVNIHVVGAEGFSLVQPHPAPPLATPAQTKPAR